MSFFAIHGFAVLGALGAAVAASAQNLSPTPPPGRFILDRHLGLQKGDLAFRGAGRSLAGTERTGYGELSVDYGVGGGLELAARTTFGAERRFTLGNGGSLRYGGSDFELVARYGNAVAVGGRTVRVGAQVGVAFPSTPAQNEALLTIGALAETDLAAGISIYLNPKIVAIDDNPIGGIGIGFNANVYPGLDLIGEIIPMISGQNTRSDFDGTGKRVTPFALGLRYRLRSGLAVEAAYTNAIGATTGFSMTPGLGGEAQGFVIGVSGKFSLGGAR